jgi:cephalosporin hydroxylase
VGGYETAAGGQSLRMWRRYFPNATIVGIDIHHKNVAGPRICFEQGSQSDKAFLRGLVKRYAPFDVVIDDGSHLGRDIATSFDVLWPAVKPGGFYVIEDIDVSYHPEWEGGPPGTPGTAADLIKRLLDDTLIRAGDDEFQPSIAALHVYHQIVFLERRCG